MNSPKQIEYSWKRYWLTVGGPLELLDRGYPLAPTTIWGRALNPGLIPLAEHQEVPCLLLVGEPGMGKSHELRATYAEELATPHENSLPPVWINLADYDNAVSLDTILNMELQAWLNEQMSLTLYLDSLDECPIGIGPISGHLRNQLNSWPCERLRLRVACRVAEIPVGFAKSLESIFGKEKTKILELAPLTRDDVHLAAQVNGLDGTSFLAAVEAVESQAFASKPNTLELLIRDFRQTKTLGSSRRSVHERGCRALVEEFSESRRDARRKGFLDIDVRFRIAGRIAAILVLSGKHSVWIGVEANRPDGALCPSDFTGTEETIGGRKVSVTEAGIEEVIQTALFASHGLQLLGFAHRTYTEFLAAWYIHESKIDPAQALRMVFHPELPGKAVVPLLSETTAWLSAFSPEILQTLLPVEPLLMLRVEAGAFNDTQRKMLTEFLLEGYDSGRLVDISGRGTPSYAQLAHPGLARQLQPFLEANDKSPAAREAAIEIAGQCRVEELFPPIADIANSPLENERLRITAAAAIWLAERNEFLPELLPLALGEAGDDPHDELKGIALRALWPGHIGLEELLGLLHPPKDPNLYGVYQSFLRHHLTQELAPADLPVVLDWALAQEKGERELIHPEVIEGILLQAWEHLSGEGVLSRFAELALLRLVRHGEPRGYQADQTYLGRLYTSAENTAKRRRLAMEIIGRMTDKRDAWLLTAYPNRALLNPEDCGWIGAQIREERPPLQRQLLSDALFYLLDRTVREDVDNAFRIWEEFPEEAALLGRHFEAVSLDDEAANWLRKRHASDALRAAHPEPSSEEVQQRAVIGAHNELERFEAGDLDGWWRFNFHMLTEGGLRDNEFRFDLAELPNWQLLGASFRDRALDAALKYLTEYDPNLEIWDGADISSRPMMAGLRAMFLLYFERPEAIRTTTRQTWSAWCPLLLAFPLSSGKRGDEARAALLQIAHKYAPEQIRTWLDRILRQQDRGAGALTALRYAGSLADTAIDEILIANLREEDLETGPFGEILRLLMKRGNLQGRALALAALDSPSTDLEKRRAMVAVGALIEHTADAAWEELWPLVSAQPELAQRVALSLDTNIGRMARLLNEKLSENSVGELYEWLEKQFPPEEDNLDPGVHDVTPRERVAELRGSLISTLAGRGTPAAFEVISRLARARPDQEGFRNLRERSRLAMLTRTWVPPKPAEVREVLRRADARWVRSGVELLDLIVEALERLNQELGEGRGQFLWNERKRALRPKEELALSDYIYFYLRDHLPPLAIGREVQVTRRPGSPKGKASDLQVTALDPENGVKLEAILEVKGCWNDDLDTSMKDQLLDDYMLTKAIPNGLYVVGHYTSDKWEESDRRMEVCERRSATEIRELLEAQARELSGPETRVGVVVLEIIDHK